MKTFLMKNTQKKILGVILLVLFLVPFFWFGRNSYNIGGDDTRLYLVFPIDWLNNVSKYSWFSSVAGGFGSYNPQQFYIPINIISSLIKNTFSFLNHQAIIYGLLLCFSFLTVYLIIFELLDRKKGWSCFWSSVIGGIFYVFIPIIFTLRWPNPIANLLEIIAFPLLFLFFLRAIKRRKISELICGGIISVVFSIALMTITGLLPFLIGIFIFFLLYFLIIELNKKTFIKYLFIYLFLITLLNSFWLIPFFDSSFHGNQQVSFSLSSIGKEGAVWTIGPLSAMTSLLDHLSGISGFSFINVNGFSGKVFEYFFQIIHLGVLFFVIILFGFLVKIKNLEKEKKILIISAVTFLCMAFLITVNIGNWGVDLFTWLIRNIPGFVAIRNFWTHVAQSYGLFYAIVLGMACCLIFSSIKRRKIKVILISFIFSIILFQAVPFINGKVVNLPIRYPQEDAQLNRNVRFPSSYLEMISYLKNSTGGNRILSLPLIKGAWSMILDEGKKGVYIGGSPIKVLAGKDDFNSDFAFNSEIVPELNLTIKNAFEQNDYYLLNNIFSTLNIKYVVYDSQMYDEHSNDFDQIREEYIWIYKYDGKQRYKQLIDNLPVKLEKTFGQWEVYKFNDEYFLPHIYSAQKLSYMQGDFNSFGELISLDDHNLRDGILFMNSAVENSFIKGKINDIFVPIEADPDKIAEMQLAVDKTTDAIDKKKLQSDLDSYTSNTFLKDFKLKIPAKATYKIYIKSGSTLLANNKNIGIQIDNEILEKTVEETGRPGWNYFNQIELDIGEHGFKVYIGDVLTNFLNSGDIVLSAENLTTPIKTPQLEYRQVNPTKYIVNVHGASESFPLVFSESFHPGWKIYVQPELARQGSGKFISENNQGTIQNENLAGGKFYDLLFRKPVLDDKHFMVNSFASAWWIDLNQVCKGENGFCVKNPDGSYDFSVSIEFEPQKYFYVGLLISGITLLSCVGYLIYDRRKRKFTRSS